MVCGVESVEDIHFFGETHLDWLKNYLFLPNGIPSADTICRYWLVSTARNLRKIFSPGRGDTSRNGRGRALSIRQIKRAVPTLGAPVQL
jgi:hypothetical protein